METKPYIAMISYFLSYFITVVGFAAAAYLTMSLKNNFSDAFWAADYYSKFGTYLRDARFKHSTIESILKRVRATRDRIDSYSRKRSCYMLMTCVSLILFMCFFNNSAGFGYENPIYYFAFISYSIYNIFITVCLQKQSFKRWRSIFIFWIIGVLVFILAALAANHINCIYDWTFRKSALIIAEVSLVMMVILPLFFYWFVNWFYSRIYMYYFRDNIGQTDSEASYYRWAVEAYTDPTFRELLCAMCRNGKKANSDSNNRLKKIKKQKREYKQIRAEVDRMKAANMSKQYKDYLSVYSNDQTPTTIGEFCKQKQIDLKLFTKFWTAQQVSHNK